MVHKTRNFLKFLLFSVLVIFSSCDKKGNVYEFDFEQHWTWQELKNHANNPVTRERIEKIKRIISIEEAHILFLYLTRLDNPTNIKQLHDIQHIQDSLGGGFYGMAPNFPQNTDTIPVPFDFDKLISTGLFLSDFRKTSYDAIKRTEYPITFYNKELDLTEPKSNHSNIELIFDFSCVKEILNAFEEKSLTLNEAIEISNLTGFKHMLEHRRNLGYIPEPLPTSETLAQFILSASSKEPLNMIWKWLSPWNYFNLSDLYMNKANYRKIIFKLEYAEKEITTLVSNKINPFVPQNYTYKDTLTFAVNWGIRSWATDQTLGTNIVQFKDNYNLLIRTISHETFHKIQSELCPSNLAYGDKDEKSFEDIVSYTFPDNKDTKFYQVLSYIFLEGTASYVGGMNASDISAEYAEAGADLLYKIYKKIYIENKHGAVDELLNKGLKSNGPFYIVGYIMSEKITNQAEPEKLRNLLSSGTLGFFNTYFEMNNKIVGDSGVFIEINPAIEKKVKELIKKVEP